MLIYNQLNEVMETNLQNFSPPFKKHCNTKYARLQMTENQEAQLQKKKKTSCLSMTFDNLNQNLLTGNPKSYNLHLTTASFKKVYLTNIC